MNSVFYDPAKISTDALNLRCENTLNTALGISYTEIGENYLEATMPVDHRTVQPRRMLNGGASLALIESLGSMAANLVLDRSKNFAVGQSVQCSHFRAVPEGGFVTARAEPVHIGKSSQVWEVSIKTENGHLAAKGTITMAVLAERHPNE